MGSSEVGRKHRQMQDLLSRHLKEEPAVARTALEDEYDMILYFTRMILYYVILYIILYDMI